MYIRFEWSDAKDLLSQRKHDVSFEVAALVFDDENCLVLADRVDDETGELRWHAIGKVQIEAGFEALLLVSHVYREDDNGEQVIRIISARAAEKHEVRRYQEQEME
ncbi:MAG: BrnT family toxin [Bryobacteraceae bacterium]